MTQKKIVNIAASVRQRLLNAGKERGEEPNIIFIQYALERILYRLSKSKYADRFILKGATLFTLWSKHPHRSTRDLDLLGLGDVSKRGLTKLFRSVCKIKVEPDGLLFDDKSITVSEIRRDQEYHGQRVKLTAVMEKARIPVQIDIGFGDAFSPEVHEIEFPTILDFPAPRIRAYNRDTVVAEKLNAMVVLGRQNSRMKDFYDIFVLAGEFKFAGNDLVETIRATFERRGVTVPSGTPLAFTKEFELDQDKLLQWKGFLRRNRLKDVTENFDEVVSAVRKFLKTPVAAAAAGKKFPQKWPKGGLWK